MERLAENWREEELLDLDERVEKMAERLKEEGFDFTLDSPNESEFHLLIGGRHFVFTKKDEYLTQDKEGNPGPHQKIEDAIEERIREVGVDRSA